VRFGVSDDGTTVHLQYLFFLTGSVCNRTVAVHTEFQLSRCRRFKSEVISGEKCK